MRIAVFGSTGGTGRNVVTRGLAAGHDMIAVARRPEAVPTQERLTVRKGDVLEAASLPAALEGAEALICTIGPAKNGNPGTLISMGTKNLVEACGKAGVKRFVFESGIMVSDGSELPFLGNLAIKVFGLIYPQLRADKITAEATLTTSSLDWVIVRPPVLDHGPAAGQVLAAPRAPIMPAKAISHADCADVLLKAATEPTWVKQIVNAGRA